jgi:hypothetical protein
VDIEQLKEKIGDESFLELTSHIADLTGQRDAARAESISGRKALKSEVETLRNTRAKLFERLGLDDDADIDALPDAKGQAEAAKQYEQKLKRVERELADALGLNKSLGEKIRSTTLESALEKAVSEFEWLDRDVAVMLAKQAIKWEDDDPYFEADGKLISIADGVKFLAGAKPHLLKQVGASGSGFRPKGVMPDDKNPWAKESFNLTKQGEIFKKDPQLAQKMRLAASR